MTRAIGKYERLALERHARDLALAALPGGHPRGLRFDLAAGDRVVRFIEEFCTHYEGEWAGRPALLEPWQKEITRSMFGWMRADGTRRFRTAYIEIGRKNGKALAIDTKIPTPSGWTPMGKLNVGDVVFDEAGKLCNVVASTEVQRDRPCYRVCFSDGTSIVADVEHEWYTDAQTTGLPRTGMGPKSTWSQRHIRTTGQILRTIHRHAGAKRVEWNHRIPVALALDTPATSLPIPPYTLGAWLGDGTGIYSRLTVAAADIGIVDAIRAEGIEADERPTRDSPRVLTFLLGSKGRSKCKESLQAKLRVVGVLGAKHIPAVYMRASRDQRLALLRGLMDTDGYAAAPVRTGSQCEFCTTVPVLRDGMLELLRSLGFKPTAIMVQPRIAGRPHAVCAPAWRIQFAAHREDGVFGLARKNGRLKNRPVAIGRSGGRQIVAVEPVESVPVRCIEVDSPSHLFLAGEGMVPTHNSFICSALAAYLLVADGEQGAQIYSTATKEEQAAIVWAGTAKMVKQSPKLRQYVKHMRSKGGRLVCERLGSFFRPLGADSGTLDGFNPHGSIVDELHAHKDRRVWDVMRTGMGARRQPLTIAITTAGTYDPESIGWLQHDYATKVLDGVFEDDSFFAFICAIDEGDDPFDEANWGKANPNLGISCKLDNFREQALEAKRQPSFMNEFLRLRLNRWTQQVTRWLSVEKWAECDTLKPRAEFEARLLGLPCQAGLDLSTKLDLTALVLDFEVSGETHFVCRFWLPEERVEEEAKKGRRHYETWVREGWITTTPGNVVDYEFIRAEVLALSKVYKLGQIGFDPYGAQQLATQLSGDGIQMIEVRQGFLSLSEPSKILEARIMSGKVRHGGNPVLAWMVGNAVVRVDPAGNIKPDKEKASDKIDGVVAAVMAISRSIVHPPVRSVYETRGIMSLD